MSFDERFWELFNVNSEDQNEEAIRRRSDLLKLRENLKQSIQELMEKLEISIKKDDEIINEVFGEGLTGKPVDLSGGRVDMSLSKKMIEEFSKAKEAFIMEELQPYFKDGKLCQKVKLRLAEIQDFKNLTNQRFEQFIKDLKERGCTISQEMGQYGDKKFILISEEEFDDIFGKGLA